MPEDEKPNPNQEPHPEEFRTCYDGAVVASDEAMTKALEEATDELL